MRAFYFVTSLLPLFSVPTFVSGNRRLRRLTQHSDVSTSRSDRSESFKTRARRRIEDLGEDDDVSIEKDEGDDYFEPKGKGHVHSEDHSTFPTTTASSSPSIVEVTNSPLEVTVPDRADETELTPTGPVVLPVPTPPTLAPTSQPSSVPSTTQSDQKQTPNPSMNYDFSAEDRFALVRTVLEDTVQTLQYDTAFDPSSYQNRALRRTSEQLGLERFSAGKVVQYWVLYCVYFATNGDGGDDATASVNGVTGTAESPEDNIFTRQEGTNIALGRASDSEVVAATIGDDSPSGWKNRGGWEALNLDPCRDGWFGITCDSSDQVTAIRLPRNGLSGIFPFQEVVLLASSGPFSVAGAGSLRTLEIYNNQNLTNEAGSDYWLASMDGLEVLNYRHTSFKGPILRLPSTLRELDCSYTQHTGSIPEDSFNGLNDLVLANLDGNSYMSSVPTSLAALPSLKFLYIRDAKLTGDLSFMEYMSSIVEHAVDRNPDLTGPLYPFIGDIATLRSFSAADCSLVSTQSSCLPVS
jgi:hypothetical protein